MLTLEDEIAALLKLGAHREEALELLVGGLRGLGGSTYDVHEQWETPRRDGPHVEHALLLQSLQIARRRGVMPDGTRAYPLESTCLQFLTGVTPQTLTMSEFGRTPVLLAARTLEAQAKMPGLAFSKPSVICLYGVLRELFSSEPPRWAMGSARAGEGCRATAFVTGECCRGVFALSRSLANAALACERFRDAHARRVALAASSRLPAQWVAVECSRIQEALEIDVAWLDFRTMFSLEGIDVADLDDAASRLRVLVDAMCSQVSEARREIEDARARETTAVARSESAHHAAIGVVGDLHARLSEIADSLTRADWEASRLRLEGLVELLSERLDPSRNFIGAVLDHELAASASHKSERDLPELAFAAAAYGMLQDDWDDPRLDRAAEVLVANVNDGGSLPTGRPFQVQENGFRLHAVGVEVLRGLGTLLCEKPRVITPDLIGSFLRLFRSTRRDVPEGIGWSSEVTSDGKRASWWSSAISLLAIDGLVRMLDRCINVRVATHFAATSPDHLKVDLDTVFYPDYGLTRADRESVALPLQRMRAHVLGISRSQYPDCLNSLVLYGPPGTGKTTCAEALARSAGTRFIQVTPSDIVVGGAEQAEHRARVVFEALALLSDTVILFDEFDPLLRRRASDGKVPSTIFELLTPGMLPKLAKLHDAAREQRVAYILATNLVGSLDDAAIRDGRFDAKVGVYPPDLVSRVGRLLFAKQPRSPEEERRLIRVCAMTHDGPMSTLGRKGWFTADDRPREGTGHAYIEDATIPPQWPTPEFSEIRPSGTGRHAEIELAEWLWSRASDWRLAAGRTPAYGGDLVEYLRAGRWTDLRMQISEREPTWEDLATAFAARPDWSSFLAWITRELRGQSQPARHDSSPRVGPPSLTER